MQMQTDTLLNHTPVPPTATSAWITKNWRPMIGIVVAFLVIVAVAVTLAVELTRKHKKSKYKFNGPKNINGDPRDATPAIFQYPQIIPSPTSTDSGFGSQMFVHDAGYIAVAAQSAAGPVLNMYYTNLQGVVNFQQRIQLYEHVPGTNILSCGLGLVTTICDGAFAPIYNVVNEVYYLFISLGGLTPGPQATGSSVYPQCVICLSLDTNSANANSMTWVVADITASSTTTLSGTLHPTQALVLPIDWPAGTAWTTDNPWRGTFGDRVRVVLDDNESILKQSIYVRGSEVTPAQPGGHIYWFVISENQVNPSLVFAFDIQDAKLLLNYKLCTSPLGPGTAGCPTPVDYATCTGATPPAGCTTPADYINGFGCDFFVTSGLGKANVLVVGNATNQDSVVLTDSAQPAAPQGYVQGYTYDQTSSNLGWQQAQPSTNVFAYRYPGIVGNVSPGFGTSVTWYANQVIVGQATPDASGDQQLLVLPWQVNPLNGNALVVIDTLSTGASQTRMYSSSLPSTQSQRYNMSVQPIDTLNTLMLTTSWSSAASTNTITVQGLTLEKTTTTYTTDQLIGATYNSGTSTVQTRYGFAQGAMTWLSRTHNTCRLIMNDPVGQRLIILNRQV